MRSGVVPKSDSVSKQNHRRKIILFFFFCNYHDVYSSDLFFKNNESTETDQASAEYSCPTPVE